MRKLMSGIILILCTLNAGMAQEQNSEPAGPARKPVPDAVAAVKPAGDPAYRIAQVAFVGAAVADLATSIHVEEGYAESNPLLGTTRAQQIGVSVGLGALTLWGASILKSQGHSRVAKVFLLLGTALHTSGAIYNATRQPIAVAPK